MKNKRYVIATIRPWNIKRAKSLISASGHYEILLITNKKDLSYKAIKAFDPRYIFFPHWSWKIAENIYKNYECIVFHMTDLPYGRGGSPLQNLIIRGKLETKISAMKVIKEIDGGPVYIKRRLSLKGPAYDIFRNLSKIIFEKMIPYIIKNKPVPRKQKGKTITFKRRTPGQGNITGLKNKKKVYNHIRMLDAEGYPPAFIETPELKIQFSNAKLKKQYILTEATIEVKK